MNQPATSSARYVSLTFDDGLIAGARKAVNLLGEFHLRATFYVVTGWVRPRQMPYIRDRWNQGRDHGDWRDWRTIQQRGHEIGSHTVTHINAGGKLARLLPGLLHWELVHSHHQLRRHLGLPPVSISMPWNAPAKTAAAQVRRIYAACRLGSRTFRTNDLARMDWHELHSWAPDANVSAAEIITQIRATPPRHWLILQFHSFDGEGYMPLTTDKFREVLRGITETEDLRQVTVREMVAQFQDGPTAEQNAKKASRSKKRVCLLTSAQLSTNPRVVKEADALCAAGFEVRVVACQWMEWPRREDAKLLKSRNWRCQIIDYSRDYAPNFFWYSRVRHYSARNFIAPLCSNDTVIQRAVGRAVPEMVRAATSEPADLFIGHNLAALPAAVLAAQARGVPAAFDAEDFHSGMWLTESGPTRTDHLATRVEQRFLSECRYVTAAAPLIAEAYAKKYGIPSPTPILNVFPLADRPATLRGNNPRSPLTLYWFSQVIGARRGLEEILQGMAQTGTKNIQLHLRGQWQPGYEQRLRQLTTSLGLDPGQLIAHELAPPDEMIRMAAQYDVGLALEHPVSENRDLCLTNKICTYLLAGNAVVVTDTRGQRHFMKEITGAGLCYKIGDVSTLSAQLREWERDRSALEIARRCAWQLGEEKFNWDIEQRKVIELVEHTLSRPAVIS